MENYEILDTKPDGQSYKATHKTTGEIVAVRKLTSEDGAVPQTLIREMLVAQKFTKSPHVVNFRHVQRRVVDNKLVYYVLYEHFDTDLRALIAGKPLHSDMIKKLLFQLLRGVYECHSEGVRHRNLNPSDIWVDEKRGFRVKIGAGIGQSFSLFQDGCSSMFRGADVSLSYQAPEALLGSETCRAAVDMWAIGCIFAEMVTGKVIFAGIGRDPDNAVNEHLYEIFRQLGKPREYEWRGVDTLPGWESYEKWDGGKKKARLYVAGDLPKSLLVASVSLDEDGFDLLSKLLTFDPAKRITTKAAMGHPYFKP